MVLIYLEFSLFPSFGIVPEDLGMAQNLSLREFGRGPEGSHESDRFGSRGCFSRTINVSNTRTKEVNGLRGCRLLNKQTKKEFNSFQELMPLVHVSVLFMHFYVCPWVLVCFLHLQVIISTSETMPSDIVIKKKKSK